MNFNSNDILTDISKVTTSVKADSQSNFGYASNKFSKSFGNEAFKNSTLWQTMIEPDHTNKTEDDLTNRSKRICRNNDFINQLRLEVVSNFSGKFSDEQLNWIVQAIIFYIKFDSKNYPNIRRYIHLFLKWKLNEKYLSGELYDLKYRISKTSIIEFEILMDLIVQLMKDNDSKYIFKIIGTIDWIANKSES